MTLIRCEIKSDLINQMTRNVCQQAAIRNTFYLSIGPSKKLVNEAIFYRARLSDILFM
jgi:hypothetical protein